MATITLAVMGRATLGHTDRDLTALRGLNTAFLLVTLGAFSRVVAPLSAKQACPAIRFR